MSAHQDIQKTVEGVVGALADTYIEAVATEDDAPEGLILAGWVLVSHWVSTDDPSSNWYHISQAAGMAPHVVDGLLHQVLERD